MKLSTVFVGTALAALSPPALSQPPLKFVGNPAASLPLGPCEGDCDGDRDCAPGLVCFERERDSDPFPPGCARGTVPQDRTDYCYDPATVPSAAPTLSVPPTDYVPPRLKFVRNPPRSPLGICEGDCDDDDDCQGDLRCFQRDDTSQRVPGCSLGGDDDDNSDFCYDVNGTYPPTDQPTGAPSSAPSISNRPSETPSAPPTEIPRLTLVGRPATRLLGLCEGHCGSDADCKPGLSCFVRPLFYSRVPGCLRGGEGDYTAMNVCFQESPSSAPTKAPTPAPTVTSAPTHAPTAGPTNYPPLKFVRNPPKSPLGLCEGDCDDDDECEPGLYCFQRRRSKDGAPGCSRSGADRGDFDVCTRQQPSAAPSVSNHPSLSPSTSSPTLSKAPTPRPTAKPTDEHFAYKVMREMKYFQIKLYWRRGYYWQESRSETFWCAEVKKGRRGSKIEIRRCSSRDEKQRWRFWKYNRFMLESVYAPGLCIKQDGTYLEMDDCDIDDSDQIWNLDGNSDKKFEWKLLKDSRKCITNHHHPTSGEELKKVSCSEARRHDTNYWTVYD